jgi:hypothetical protein
MKQVASRANGVRLSAFSGLHGVISQKIEFFMATSVRISIPADMVVVCIKNLPLQFWNSSIADFSITQKVVVCIS